MFNNNIRQVRRLFVWRFTFPLRLLFWNCIISCCLKNSTLHHCSIFRCVATTHIFITVFLSDLKIIDWTWMWSIMCGIWQRPDCTLMSGSSVVYSWPWAPTTREYLQFLVCKQIWKLSEVKCVCPMMLLKFNVDTQHAETSSYEVKVS